MGGTLDGWELSGITRYQSGAPLTITGSAAVGTRLSSFGRRASTVPSHLLSDLPRSRGSCPAHKVCWFDGAAFTTAPTTSAGDAPIGSIIGPNSYTWHLSLRKSFKLPKESMNLMFQADAFNVLTGSTGTTLAHRPTAERGRSPAPTLHGSCSSEENLVSRVLQKNCAS